MKRFTILILLAFALIECKAQLGASYHFSEYPTVGVMYEFKERLRPEVRFGGYGRGFYSNYVTEVILAYDIVNKTDYEFYIGAGLNNRGFEPDLMIPIGLNIYPFENKQFGFHIEAVPLVFYYQGLLVKCGFRYKFSK